MKSLTSPVLLTSGARISQEFGEHPEYYSQYGYPAHNGRDYAIEVGTEIFASEAGIITKVEIEDGGYGKHIKIDHGEISTVYAHLNEFLVNVGEVVVQGELIGLSGNTGNSTGPHLHFGVRENVYYLTETWQGWRDPRLYLIDPEDSIPNGVGVTKDHLNIRTMPNVNSEVIGTLHPGAKVNVYEEEGDWRYISIEGWAHGDWILEEGE